MEIFGERFEWDEVKNKTNQKKHGFSFEAILPMFDDPFFLERFDGEHSSVDENRFFGLGRVQDYVVVSAAYVENKRIRIISARLATPREEQEYYNYVRSMES